jgi:chromosomal replication initiation ATPase DnaA
VAITAPDDAALSQILRKLLRDRHLRVEDRVIDYVVRRIERSAPAARRAAEMLDRAAGDMGGKVSLRQAALLFGDRQE